MLQTAKKYRKIVKKICCPGLATGTGCVRPDLAVFEMARAYKKYIDQGENS